MLETGNLISDDIVLSVLCKKLDKLQSGYILDGFPRNLNQAITLDQMLKEKNSTIDYVIYLSLDKETAKKRIVGRVSCPNCGNVYNTMIEGMNSKIDMICDDCNIDLIKRSDDNSETFDIRFMTYIKETEPVIEYYKNKGILYQVDSSRNTEQVYEDIKGILND